MEEKLSKSEIKRRIIDAAIDEYVNTSKRTRSATAIAKKYGINRKTLLRHLKDRGIEITSSHGAKELNETIFDVIDTEEKAYWLGFLYADGYVALKTNAIGLHLSLKDLNHMEKFRSFIGWEGEIKIREDHQFGTKDKYSKTGEILYNCGITINCAHMKESLIKLGCVPNKSLILTFPTDKQVPEQFKLAFIRGYFDGDGTLGLYKHSKINPKLEESLMFVGTKQFLEGIQKYLGIGYLMHKTNCNEATYRLGYSTKKAFIAAELMYKNATIYLDRKYDIYINEYVPHNRAKSVNPEIGNTEVNDSITKGESSL